MATARVWLFSAISVDTLMMDHTLGTSCSDIPAQYEGPSLMLLAVTMSRNLA